MSVAIAAVLGVVLQAQLVAALPRVPLPEPAPGVTPSSVHQNTASAGRLDGTTFRLALDVVESAWHPEGLDDPQVPILAFAERGMAPLVPGPLVRIPLGTEMLVVLRNSSDSAVVIGGLRPGFADGVDTVQLRAGEMREVRYRVNEVGTFQYWGAFLGTTPVDRYWKDSQLNGAIVVDGPGKRVAEHILVISEWFLDYPDGRPFEVVAVINGKGWPHTETIQLQQGDSTRFRIINATALFHPMHLHGFFYQIESRGDGRRDAVVPQGERHFSNTDLIAPFATFTLAFVPHTPGNWLFHCHFSFHVDETASLSGSPGATGSAAGAATDADHTAYAAPTASGKPAPAHEGHSMRGLVVGVKVAPSPDYVAQDTRNARDMRLFVQKSDGRLFTGAAAYGFALQSGDSAPARDSVVLPGPVLELRRNEPVRIVLTNNLDEPTSIHWHGLEIESFPDGVPDWSGMGTRVFSQIAPRDSFVAEFVPTRSGTYPYHSHLNDRHQVNSGMYGALIVTDEPRDLTRDHVIVAGGGGPEVRKKYESPFALVNGSRFPAPLRLTVGETHRLRIVSIHPDWRIAYTLKTDSTVARWRAIAKDGADLPSTAATMRAAHTEMGPGQTADFEFTPTEPGEWRLEVRSVDPGWYIPLRVIVQPAPSGTDDERDYLYLWSGSTDSTQSDFLAVLDVTEDSTQYGSLVTTLPVPGRANGPHHTEHEMPADAQLFANGFRSGQSVIFDLRNPPAPRIVNTFGDVAGLSHPHSFVRLPSGNVLGTFQMQHTASGMRAGGIVEMTPAGETVRSRSANAAAADTGLRVYSAAVVPSLDRIVTTTSDMVEAFPASRMLQLWKSSDLSLLHTFTLPDGPLGDESLYTAEPRVLKDGRTVMVSTFNCALYLLEGLESDSPSGRLVASFPRMADRYCAIPVVAGDYYLITVPALNAVLSLDISDPAHPREVSRLSLGSGNIPHWIAMSPDQRRLVITGYGGLSSKVLLAQFDKSTGQLSLDERFRDPGSAESGFRMDNKSWPHGGSASAVPHGAVFSRP